MGFVVDKVALGYVSLNIIPPALRTHLFVTDLFIKEHRNP
jgi:hypothetical protein